jgi:hypothetical protein
MLTLGAMPAAANTISPNFLGATDNLDGTYTWTYEAYLSTGTLVDSQEFFTIYDIYGYQPGSLDYASATGNSWSPSESLVGLTPAGTTPADSASLMNVTFKYAGSTSLTAGFSDPPKLLGTFWFTSTVSAINPNGVWVSQDLPLAGGGFQTAKQPTAVPMPDGGWTVAMLGSALLAIGLLRRRIGVR